MHTNFFIGNSYGKRPIERPKRRLEEMTVREIHSELEVTQNRIQYTVLLQRKFDSIHSSKKRVLLYFAAP